jgi:hypothetical protein
MQTVYFRKFSLNETTGSATLIVTNEPMTIKKTSIAGINVGSKTQGNLTFGVLSLSDPETGAVMKADHPTMIALQSKLSMGDAIPGFQLSTNPVMNLKTGEETDLRWVEAVQ